MTEDYLTDPDEWVLPDSSGMETQYVDTANARYKAAERKKLADIGNLLGQLYLPRRQP